MLCIHDVLHGLLQHCPTVVVGQEPFAVQPVLFQPPQLLTMGTIGPYGLPVAADGTINQAVGIVEERISAFEIARLLGAVVDEARLHLLHGIDVALHLQIPVAIIRETWVPHLLTSSLSHSLTS